MAMPWNHYCQVTLRVFLTSCTHFFGCRTYNAADTIYYKIADKLESYLENYIETHVTHEPR